MEFNLYPANIMTLWKPVAGKTYDDNMICGYSMEEEAFSRQSDDIELNRLIHDI